ncbi:MAG TPA: NYN domain-containing protein [Candidatus Microsaccharimonas sp.]|nr:NYN domain-containing protein [Candidatus Microsaccharimonas sp.]
MVKPQAKSKPKLVPKTDPKSNPKSRPEHVYAFIDSQNLNVGTQKFGWKMNWARFRTWLSEEYGVEKAFMFIGYIPENEALYEQMHDAGFLVVLKQTYDMTRVKEEPKLDANGKPEEKPPVKGNVDTDLVLWTMKELGNYQKAIIVSGDGDFFSLVEYLHSKKRLLHVMTPSGHYSQLYNAYQDYIVQLDHYKRTLQYRDRKRKPTATK